MPYIPPDVVAKAKEMDLLTYLRYFEPEELIHFGGDTYCTREHDSLKISNGKWYWFSRRIGGKTALDYLIKVKEMPFVEAVERITGQAAVTPIPHTPEINRIVLRLDRDYTGRTAGQALSDALSPQYTVTTKPPPQGKDYNDYLCLCKGIPISQPK